MIKKREKPYAPADGREYVLRFWIIVVAICGSDPGFAQAIETNRPSFSFSASVVGPGEWQLETGVKYTRSDANASTTALPEAEIRVGVADRVEVFVSSLTWSRKKISGSETSGLSDVVLGTKINVSDASDRTRMGLLFQVSAPTGDDGISSDRWDPSVAFIWAHSGDFAIAGTVKVSEFESGYQLDNGLLLPIYLGESHGAFIEWEANLPEGGGSTHWLNGGYQWLLDDHMQIDFNAGLGLNDRTDDYRMGVGFSIRL